MSYSLPPKNLYCLLEIGTMWEVGNTAVIYTESPAIKHTTKLPALAKS